MRSLPVSNRVAATLLVCAVLLAYGNSLGNGFVWDDSVLVVGKSSFYGDLANVPAALTSPDGALVEDASSYYRPVAALDYFVDEHLFGGVPLAYHLESVLLHLVVTLLFWRLVARTFHSPDLGLISALLFAVHPVGTEAVNFVSARNNLLCAGFMLASLKLLEDGDLRGRRAALALGSYALALLSKEPAVVLPAFVAFWWWPRVVRGARAATLVSFLAVTGAYLLLRFALLGTVATDAEFRGIGLPLAALFEDVRLLFLPVSLDAHHFVAPVPPDSLRAILAIVFALVLVAASFLAPAPLRWGSAWLLLGLAPVANVVPFHSAPVAERYLYIPALGSALIVGAGLEWLLAHRRVVGLAVGVVMLAWMLGQTISRNRVWESDETLALSMLEAQSRNPTARVLLGSAYREQGMYDEAVEQYRKALELQPRNVRAYTNLGNVYLESRSFDDAVEAFEAALHLDPGNVLVRFLAGVAADAAGDRSKAVAHYEGFILEARRSGGPRYGNQKRRARVRLAALRDLDPGDAQ